MEADQILNQLSRDLKEKRESLLEQTTAFEFQKNDPRQSGYIYGILYALGLVLDNIQSLKNQHTPQRRIIQ